MRQLLRPAMTIGLAGLAGLFCLTSYLLIGKIVTLALAGWGVSPLEIAVVTPWRIAAFVLLSALSLFAYAAVQNSGEDEDEWVSPDHQVAAMRAILDRSTPPPSGAASGSGRTEVA